MPCLTCRHVPDQNPDPLVRGMDPDPDPSVSKQKKEEKPLIPTVL
jgi:hypothetical protein